MARGGGGGGGRGSKDSTTPQRTSPLLPFTMTRCLYSLATAALFPTHLFSLSLKYLTSPMPLSPSPSPSAPTPKGIEGAAMWSTPTNGSSAPTHHTTSLVSTLSTEELAKLTWAVARGHSHGIPPLPSHVIECVWDPVLKRTSSSLGKSLGKGKGVVSTATTATTTSHSSHYASIVWAATTCSMPAVEACALALEHASLCPQAYSLQALAQTLWAASIQGVTVVGGRHSQMHRIIEYVVLAAESAERKEEKGQGGGVTTTPSLDSVAASLLHPSSRGLVRRVQAQLWTAFVALACHESKELPALVSLVPLGAQAAWRSAALEVGIAPPTPPKLMGDVCRVLTLAKVRHTVNKELLEGRALGGGFTMGIALHQGSKEGDILDVLGPGAYLNAHDREGSSGGQSFEDSASRSSALARVLRPTLVTRVRQEWGVRAGYKVTPLSFAEWDSRPSTDEKLELLAIKGVAIPRELL